MAANEKYIIIKVRNANHKKGYLTPVGLLRKMIHKTAEEQGISEADIVTHTQYMDKEDSETVARIFSRAMARAKEGHERGYW